MEDKWENFWNSGRVTDYLAYRDDRESGTGNFNKERIEGKEPGAYGTVRGTDRDGSDGHAY